MKLIVGLGNPGLIYAGSRHNIGFGIVKSLAGSLKASFKRDNTVFALVSKVKVGEQEVILALPQTFMNLSGIAVKALLKKFKVSAQDLLIVGDDLDLELGRIRIRPNGSSGGQKGIESIIQHLGTREFSRLRAGIGRPRNPEDAARYVLAGFLNKEKAIVEQAKEEAMDCCLNWVKKDIVLTMNMFNQKGRTE